MAYELVREVFDHAPEMTPAERLLLVAIAEECRSSSRIREIPTEVLLRRTCLEPRGLRDAVARLDARGIKVRIALSLDRRGKPVYAVPGKPCRWILPPFPGKPGCRCIACSSKAEPQLPLQTEEEPERQQTELQRQQTELQLRQTEPQRRHLHTIPFPSGGDRQAMIEHIRAVTAQATAARHTGRKMSTGVPSEDTGSSIREDTT